VLIHKKKTVEPIILRKTDHFTEQNKGISDFNNNATCISCPAFTKPEIPMKTQKATQIEPYKDWRGCNTQVFWGEIAPCNHLVQIYENDDILLDSLEGFVESGIQTGDSVIIIATEAHLEELDNRLKGNGLNVGALRATDQYIPLDAETTLTKFMVRGWPDQDLFMKVVTDLIIRARGTSERQVRAYGEMVAILWAQGHNGATVHLEYLWNKFCETESFCLFCAYPKSGFTQSANDSLQHICTTHSKVIAGDKKSKKEIFYKSN
jgi:hypothetical protein